MIESRIIEVQGVFAGAAIRTDLNFRFVAVHPKLADMNDSEWQSLSDVRNAVSNRLRGVIADKTPARTR